MLIIFPLIILGDRFDIAKTSGRLSFLGGVLEAVQHRFKALHTLFLLLRT